MTLEEKDKKYVWHPFTQMQEWMGEDPLIIERGEGHYLIDVQGKRYLDGVSSLWCNVHGHRKKELDDALKQQIDKIAHSTFLGLSHAPGIELAAKLIEIAPKGLRRVFYSDSGYRLLGIISPIENEPSCSTDICHVHPGDKKILGALDVVVSLEGTDREILRTEKGITALALFVFILSAILTRCQ